MGLLDSVNPFSSTPNILTPRGVDSKIMRGAGNIIPGGGGHLLRSGANLNEEAGRKRNLYAAAAVAAAYFGQWGAAASLAGQGAADYQQDKLEEAAMGIGQEQDIPLPALARDADEASQAASAAERRRRRAQAGMSQTALTGSMGDVSVANVSGKTLLGQ